MKMFSCIWLYGMTFITSVKRLYTKSYFNFSDAIVASELADIRLVSVIDTFSLQFEIFGILLEDNSGASVHSFDPRFLSFLSLKVFPLHTHPPTPTTRCALIVSPCATTMNLEHAHLLFCAFNDSPPILSAPQL